MKSCKPPRTPKHICSVVNCSKTFKTVSALQRHERDHIGPSLQCDQCNFTCPATRTDTLRRHRNIHKLKVPCELCGKLLKPNGILHHQKRGCPQHNGRKTLSSKISNAMKEQIISKHVPFSTARELKNTVQEIAAERREESEGAAKIHAQMQRDDRKRAARRPLTNHSKYRGGLYAMKHLANTFHLRLRKYANVMDQVNELRHNRDQYKTHSVYHVMAEAITEQDLLKTLPQSYQDILNKHLVYQINNPNKKKKPRAKRGKVDTTLPMTLAMYKAREQEIEKEREQRKRNRVQARRAVNEASVSSLEPISAVCPPLQIISRSPTPAASNEHVQCSSSSIPITPHSEPREDSADSDDPNTYICCRKLLPDAYCVQCNLCRHWKHYDHPDDPIQHCTSQFRAVLTETQINGEDPWICAMCQLALDLGLIDDDDDEASHFQQDLGCHPEFLRMLNETDPAF